MTAFYTYTHQNTTTVCVPRFISQHRAESSQDDLKRPLSPTIKRYQGVYFSLEAYTASFHACSFPFSFLKFIFLTLRLFNHFPWILNKWKFFEKSMILISGEPVERLFSRGSLSLHSKKRKTYYYRKTNDKKSDFIDRRFCSTDLSSGIYIFF